MPLNELLTDGGTATVGDGRQVYTRQELLDAACVLGEQLKERGATVIGLRIDNGPGWVMADLAAARSGIPIVPIPYFFSAAQTAHALAAAGVDVLIDDTSVGYSELGFMETTPLSALAARVWRRDGNRTMLPGGTAKISFTSGTTGKPKGVCLSVENQIRAARAVITATRELELKRHLCLLPLPILLENVAGVYAVMLSGAQCLVPPLAEVGVYGSSQFDGDAALRAVNRLGVHSIILHPQMLALLLEAVEQSGKLPGSLRFVAVGGGRVAGALLARSRRIGLPVFEGYGLTECASVVAMNTTIAQRPGSVGKLLDHVDLEVAADGELVIRGNRFLGYLGSGPDAGGACCSGDLGYTDDEGFLYVTGRKSDRLVTAFGRNLSPEWPEAELTSEACIAQAAVFGEARPYCVAILVPKSPRTTDEAMRRALAAANDRLPDYARIRLFIRADEPFTCENAMLTGNGRIRRRTIQAAFGGRIDSLYDTPLRSVH